MPTGPELPPLVDLHVDEARRTALKDASIRWPSVTLSRAQQADVELLAAGWLSPSQLPDEDLSDGHPEGTLVALRDVEGTMVAALEVGRRLEAVEPIDHPDLRTVRLGPATVRARVADLVWDRVGFSHLDAPLDSGRVAALSALLAGEVDGIVVGLDADADTHGGLDRFTLVRAVQTALDAAGLLDRTILTLLPRGSRPADPTERRLRERMARAVGASVLADDLVLAHDGQSDGAADRDGVPRLAVHAIPPAAQLTAALRRGDDLSKLAIQPEVAAVLRSARPPRRYRGLVVFLTGLSGSGKSTVAGLVAARLRESGQRDVTLLDGDEVRTNLSSGLGFSREDRDRNVRRIGWVAAQIARHGGTAVCCPIAPYDDARRVNRQVAEQHGAGFVLVHVATPLAVCEARDRKGLYAKARAGIITGFTGIDDPYEEPGDSEVTVDTTAMTPQEAAAVVLRELVAAGWIDPLSGEG